MVAGKYSITMQKEIFLPLSIILRGRQKKNLGCSLGIRLISSRQHICWNLSQSACSTLCFPVFLFLLVFGVYCADCLYHECKLVCTQ